MKSILICVAVLILSSIATGNLTTPITNEKPIITTGAPEKPIITTGATEKPIITTGATEKPIITTGTTEKPITTTGTTEKPDTTTGTTEKPDTTTGTTEKPITTPGTTEKSSTHIPSTSHIPTPKPLDKYVVTGPNGEHCLVLTTEISYKYSHKNISEEGSIFSNATYNGSCSDKTDELSIYSSNVHLDLVFAKNKSEKFLKKVVLSFGDQNLTVVKDNMTELLLKNDEYFICKSSKKITLTNSFITFKNLTLDIFRNATDVKPLGSRHICVEDMKTSSIVPIAVGAALAGLVITVLIAYLIGRKRSRRGYESV